ncbi:MAG TPA: putative glycoside hydrolase [Bryobacteraceae bacterium]|nr:putative glycoside hydrolase [Bryobacteraceae bacterium]
MKIVVRAAAGLVMTAALTLGAEFSGSVVDAATGKPISGAIVTLGAKDTRTGANGGFRILGDGPLVQARAYGYDRTHVTADAHNAKSLRLTLHAITPHAVYLSFWGVSSSAVREPVLNLAKSSPVNAIVIDVKGDMGYVSFKTASPLASEIGAEKMTTIPDIHALIDRLHSQGFYTIGRIVTFKDNMLCRAHPEWAVKQNGHAFKDREGLAWCDPFNQQVRDYNVGLGIEAAKAGFDEIEFDYVRFPDTKGVEFSRESTEESRPKAIDGFLREAQQKLLPYNVFLAADVFGYICWNQNDTGIGQRIGDVAEVLDYISPMLYPSGFSFGIPNYRNPVQHPYEIVRLSLDRAAERTKIDPKRFRPWLQAFADYAFDKRQFGPKELQAQIKAAEDFGSDGWLLWNPRNVYSAEAIRSFRRSETVAAAHSVVKAGAGQE